MSARSLLVPVIFDGPRPARGSLAALSQAHLCAQELEAEVTAVVVGRELPDSALAALGRYGAARVVLAAAEPGVAGSWVTAVSACLQTERYGYVLMAGGTLSGAVAGAVAARFNGGFVGEVTSLSVSAGAIRAQRPVFGDRQLAEVAFRRLPGVMLARAGAFSILERDLPDASIERIEQLPVHDPARDSGQPAVTLLASGGVEDPGRLLAQAEVIVTGGRGLGGPAGFEAVERLAVELGELIGESAVGATRAVVDAGWRDVHQQIGLTGRSVSPKLYVAVAVSGAPQHRSGMETSQLILAINNDPRAPIFKIADLGLVADYETAVPALISALVERTRTAT